MIFEQIATGGCQSYLVGCTDTCAAALIDPELSQVDRYVALAARESVRIRYLVDTHTHADHFSGTRELARRLEVPVVMHRASPAPFVDMRLDDGEMLVVGNLRLRVMHTPGHTPRLDVPDRGGPRVHRRHAPHRRHRTHRSPDRRPGGAARQPVQPPAQARPGARGVSGARLQGPGPYDHRAGARRESAAAESRPRGVRGDDAQPQPVDADASHRGAADQHERREDRRPASRRSGGDGAVHVARGAQGAGRGRRRPT